MQNNYNDKGILLELGDIIEFNAPSNSDIHNHNFYINYIDLQKMKVISLSDNSNYVFNFNEDGRLSDESIESINLLSRSAVKGYIKQNNIELHNWINIYFGGDYPSIVTGEITSIEEDMLEITTYPDLEIIFIDFGYSGIPENIPIDSISITNKPESLKHLQSLSLVKDEIDNGNLDEIPSEEPATIEIYDNGDSIVNIPEETSYDSNIQDELVKSYAESNNIIFGKKLDPVKMYVEVPDEEQRFDIQTQVNDLMDDLISIVPNEKKTILFKKKIHNLITRFKELRQAFSKFDSNNTIYDIQTNTATHKPLVKSYENLNKHLNWIIPIVTLTKNICIPNINMNSNDTNYQERNGLNDLINLQTKYYKQKQSNIDYRYMLNTIHNTFTPFINPSDDNLNNVIYQGNINDSFNALIDNLYLLKSSAVEQGQVKIKPFQFQNFILGSSYLREIYSNNVVRFEKTQITPNDTMHIKSFILLPKSVIDYSKVNLKSSNILSKSISNLNNFSNFRLFNKKIKFMINKIDDLNKEVNYKTYKSISNNTIDMINNINYFSIDNDNLNVDTSDYSRFLETIFPKTMNILKIFRNQLNKCYSQKAIIEEIEPFLIYQDDITYFQYKEIRFIVNENIKKIKETYSKMSIIYNKFNNRVEKEQINAIYENNISNLIKDDSNLHEKLIHNYNIDPACSNSETLQQILSKDNGVLFNALLSSHMNILNTPKSLVDILEKADIDSMDQENKYIDDCFKRYLSKKYTSIESLQKDNNSDIFFDKELDDSPYHLLNKYEQEEKTMSSDDFIDFLAINLTEKHNIEPENASQLSKILVNKEKPVENGHFALLTLEPHLIDKSKINDDDFKKLLDVEKDVKTKQFYYKRVKNVWVKDDSIDDISFLDTNELFCNISDKCFKNTKTNVCETNETTNLRFHNEIKEKLLNEFDKRYNINADELEKQNQKRIHYFSEKLSLINILNDVKEKKQNNLSLLLGSYANTEPIIKSPYSDKLKIIMNDNDFVKKQHNIIKFVDYYTRKPIIKELNESKWWLYCKEMNITLLPLFVYELAIAFVENNNYFETLNRIISEQGDEDGKYIVDKYTGWNIISSNYVEEEQYESSGRKIINKEILSDNINIASPLKVKAPKMFENKESEKIYNVFSTICDNIGIVQEKIEEEVIRLSNDMCNTEIMSKVKYELKTKALKEKKGKDSPSYEQYYNETLVIIVASNVLVSIQTAIPSIIFKKTFPGCKKSFSGYPFNGVEDLTGIKYISCVINKTKSTIKPWDSITKYNENIIMNRIKMTIDKVFIKRTDINEKILKKKEFLILNPDKIIIDSIGVQRWTHFLPPLVDINLPKIVTNIPPEFKNELYKSMLKSRFNQFVMYNTIVSKNHKITLSIINNINKIVNKMPTLLNTKSSVPFLDNACCNEIDSDKSPFNYFSNIDDSLRTSLKAIQKNKEIIDSVHELSKAPLLIHKDSIHSQYPDINYDFSEENIYRFFIYHCRYDTIYDVPIKFKNLCGEKPEGYNANSTIEEKIVFLKKNDRKFSQESCKILLNLINKENINVLNLKLNYSFLEPLKDIIHRLDHSNSSIIEQPLRKNLLKVLNNYKKDKFYNEPNADLKSLKNYLYRTNNNLLIQIMDFLSKYGNLNDSLYEKYKNHLFNIVNWNIDTNNDSYYDNGIFNICQSLKNSIHNYCKYYPSLILNGKINNTVHKHWNLSEKHNKDIKDIIDDYYSKISKFINEKSLEKIIQMATHNLIDIVLFIDNIPLHTPFNKENNTYYTLFDKETMLSLFKYGLYSCFYEYINLTDNEEIFNLNVEYNKKIIKENKDTVNDNDIVSVSNVNIENTDLNQLHEVEISKENIDNIKSKVSNLIKAFIDIDVDNKKNIDYSYEETYNNVKKQKNLEKNNMVEKLGAMEVHDRKIENVLKKYRLEKWNVANQKGHITYDKNAYDNDIYSNIFNDNDPETDSHFIIDNENGILEENEDDLEDNFEGRNYDISELDENFNDGLYYSEDIEEDFFND